MFCKWKKRVLYGIFETEVDKTIPLCYNDCGDDMFENIENLKLQSVYEGISAENASFVNKPSHFIIYKLYGTSRYFYEDGRILDISGGQIIYFPKGSCYSVNRLSQGESRYIAVRFESDGLCESKNPELCTLRDGTDAKDVFRSMNRLWLSGGANRRLKCYSVFYGLLSSLAKCGEHEYIAPSARNLIRDSMEYLESHIFDVDFSVEHLVEKSGVSGTYYRKCFTEMYGVSPKKYILEKRLARAKSIFDGGDYPSVSLVARSVGYEDALYFGKAFKKRYGVPPAEYKYNPGRMYSDS